MLWPVLRSREGTDEPDKVGAGHLRQSRQVQGADDGDVETCWKRAESWFLCCAVVKAQMNLTEEVLATCDSRAKFKALMTEMFDFPKTSCPFQRGEPGGVLR